MADNTTELEVLDQIVDVLGGQSGQYETVVPTLQQIRDLLGGGGGGGGYNPSLSVGRADALTGADSTAQWATRESTGSCATTVRSVQGATEVQDGELVPVHIAGIASTDAQGGELDAIEWPTQTLRAAGSVADELTSDELVTRVGVVDLGTLTWVVASTSKPHRFLATFNNAKNNGDNTSTRMSNASCAAYETVTAKQAYDGSVDKSIGLSFYNNNQHILISDSAYSDAADFKAAMSGVLLFYQLATPTTTPISPTLPMTYRVEQGGSESIIVPAGEISAAPVLTIAEGESAAELVMDALACIATPDGPVATANHAVGTYLTMQGKLYKVTRAIASGETIASGTNVTATTVMAELLALAN